MTAPVTLKGRASISAIYIHVEDASTTVLVHKPLALDECEYPTLEVRAQDGTPLASLFFRSVADLHARALEIVKATETVAVKEGGDPHSAEPLEAAKPLRDSAAEPEVEGARGSAREAVLASPPSLAAPLVDDEWTPGGNQGIGL